MRPCLDLVSGLFAALNPTLSQTALGVVSLTLFRAGFWAEKYRRSDDNGIGCLTPSNGAVVEEIRLIRFHVP